MFKAYRNFWHNIFNFSGTATLVEFWIPLIFNYLFALIAAWLIANLAGTLSGQVVSDVYLILFALAWVGQISVTMRRLHDSNHSGWWFWIQFIPVIGTLWLLILLILPGTRRSRWR
ncbi:DUF805 domain-containing protein [Fructilactobacillus myrtifloralis]|uniref:DUF805 domain-containing protein n=1 Tax=Fructilactobacillus myrtifloralis TaxID=2940301 RepID=A0ABY5BPC3_9LACO|nr:DUF805 domain-containing protein [Fructilactobacillus myrtifloralis]USS85415.1 DUF805 domain-containing protein [Fructilactobacillus myrtifloralis]